MSQEKENKIQQAQMQSTEGELEDEELEAVAGGTGWKKRQTTGGSTTTPTTDSTSTGGSTEDQFTQVDLSTIYGPKWTP
jgi:hypothetical protein